VSTEDVAVVREALKHPDIQGIVKPGSLAAFNRLQARLARLERIEEAAHEYRKAHMLAEDSMTGVIPHHTMEAHNVIVDRLEAASEALDAALAATEEGGER
jgi:hypothetical protein